MSFPWMSLCGTLAALLPGPGSLRDSVTWVPLEAAALLLLVSLCGWALEKPRFAAGALACGTGLLVRLLAENCLPLAF